MAEDKKAAEEGGEPKKKSKLLFFIIVGVGALLLGGGGFFAYTKFLAPPPEAAEEGAIEPVKLAEIADAVGEMYAFDPFVVNLSDPKGKRYLKVKLTMEVDTPEVVERATKLAPKLRDVVIVMLTSLTFEEVMTPEGKIQIREELLERFNRTMRPDRVRNIYFTDFVVQ